MEAKTLELLDFHKIKKMLNKSCDSEGGKSIADAWNPFVDADTVTEKLDETEAAYKILLSENTPSFSGLKNVKEFVLHTRKEVVLRPEECILLLSSLETYAQLKSFFQREDVESGVLEELATRLYPLPSLRRLLAKTFDERGRIKDTASVRLQQLRNKQIRLQERLKQSMEALIQKKEFDKFLQESLVTLRNDRYVIPIKAEYRHSIPGIVHGRSATGQTLYIEPMVSIELNNDLQEAVLAEEDEIKRIMTLITETVAKDADIIIENFEIVARLDFIFARAKLAISMEGIRSIRSKDGYLRMTEMRHPLLEKEKVVPISMVLGIDYNILVITGSNTGGKTVALKTLGLLAAMNQAGLFIPAKAGSELPIFKNIWAAIGDEQSMEESLSTFSGHMNRIITIMSQVTTNDLVLLDELCSGTDPVEGAALAIAILDYFWDTGCLSVVTTHYSELKRYVYTHEGMENAHVEFDEVTLTPTYHLHTGVAGNSQAIRITRRLGMIPEVLARADELKKKSAYYEMENIIDKLNSKQKFLHSEEMRLAEEIRKTKLAHAKWDRDNKQLQREKRAILQKARDNAHALKRSLRVEAETIIKGLKKAQKDSLQEQEKAIQKSRTLIDRINIPKAESRPKIPVKKITPGMTVYIETLGKAGKVVEEDGKRCTVNVDGLKVTVKKAQCFYPTEEEKQKKETKQSYISTPKLNFKSAKLELNVIGKTVDEAMPEVESFLDDAVMAGLSTVEIIHGKGTGALREGIHENLRRSPYVVSFEMADASLGGSGVTIVRLK